MVSLRLSCMTLSFTTPRRFIPTHPKSARFFWWLVPLEATSLYRVDFRLSSFSHRFHGLHRFGDEATLLSVGPTSPHSTNPEVHIAHALARLRRACRHQ